LVLYPQLSCCVPAERLPTKVKFWPTKVQELKVLGAQVLLYPLPIETSVGTIMEIAVNA